MFTTTNFIWCPMKIKYLGVWFSPTLPTTIRYTFNALITKLQSLLSSWSPLHLSWWGRLDTIKMMIVPHVLYTVSMLPFRVPSSYFTQINSICSRFLWNNKHPRIALTKLRRPKTEGGVRFPDFKLYHSAFLIRQYFSLILDYADSPIPRWIILERSLLNVFSFQNIIHMSNCSVISANLILKYSQQLLYNIFSDGLDPYQRFLSSTIWYNKFIKYKHKSFYYKHWKEKGLTFIHQLILHNSVIPFHDLQL